LGNQPGQQSGRTTKTPAHVGRSRLADRIFLQTGGFFLVELFLFRVNYDWLYFFRKNDDLRLSKCMLTVKPPGKEISRPAKALPDQIVIIFSKQFALVIPLVVKIRYQEGRLAQLIILFELGKGRHEPGLRILRKIHG
jgi:hypothetical protein